jgi:3-oxoacyl-[acyl-carrier-protein] synthase III
MRLHVAKTGFYAPPRIQTAAELGPLIGRSTEWIEKRTGVKERRISDVGMQHLAAAAARDALGDGPAPDLIINASLTPVQLIPDSSVFIQQALGTNGIPSFSIHATCMSFLVGLHTAGALLSAGAYKRILVVSAEQGSICRDMDHPESAALIGDGAGAAVLTPPPAGSQSALLAWKMSTWPEGSDLAELRGCGTSKHPNDPETTKADNLFRMRGPRIYKMAVMKVHEMVDELLATTGMTADDIDVIVPHQASGPAMSTIPRFGGLDPDKIVNIVGEYGNCIAASLPMALATAERTGRLKRGHTVLMLGTGAGLSVAGAILRW